MEQTGMPFTKLKNKVFFFAFVLISLVLLSGFANAASLPEFKESTETCGTTLNEYLQVQHNTSGGHTNITCSDIFIKSPATNVKAFGAVGNGINDDTIAIQAAMDFVEAQGGGTLYFPHGTYIITSNITWKNGVRLEGEQGGFFNPNTYSEIVWGGEENGTMLMGEIVGDNWHSIDVIRLSFRGSGTDNPKTIIDFRDRVDWGTVFWKCHFSNTNGDAIILRKSSTNFYMYDFSVDSIGGYFIYANGSWLGNYNLDKFAYNAGDSADISKGFLFIDGLAAPNNQVNKVSISNTKLEVNANLSGDNNTLILLGVNPSISDYIQYHIVLDNVWLKSSANAENLSLVKSVPASNQFFIIGTDVQVESKDEIISGSVTPGPIQGKLHPFFVFAPFASGSPGLNNEILSFIGKFHISGNIGINEINFTEKLALNGSLKIQNSSGTLALYMNESTGYVGIGTTTPKGNLEVAPMAIIYLNRTGARNWRFFADGSGNFWVQMVSPAVNAIKLNSSGATSFIGSTTSDTQVDMGVYGSGIYNLLKLRNLYISDNNQGTRIIFSSRTANTSFGNVAGIAGVMTDNNNTFYKGELIFYTANGTTFSEKMRIDSYGTLILASNKTGIICNATTEGGIMYSNQSKKYYGCNSTEWNELY